MGPSLRRPPASAQTRDRAIDLLAAAAAVYGRGRVRVGPKEPDGIRWPRTEHQRHKPSGKTRRGRENAQWTKGQSAFASGHPLPLSTLPQTSVGQRARLELTKSFPADPISLRDHRCLVTSCVEEGTRR